MKELDLFTTLGYTINAVCFIYGVLALKSTEVCHSTDRTIFSDYNDEQHCEYEEKWTTAKLPIIGWILILLTMLAPCIGGFISCMVIIFYIDDYLSITYETRQKPFYIKLKVITKKVLTILLKPFKWLLIKV